MSELRNHLYESHPELPAQRLAAVKDEEELKRLHNGQHQGGVGATKGHNEHHHSSIQGEPVKGAYHQPREDSPCPYCGTPGYQTGKPCRKCGKTFGPPLGQRSVKEGVKKGTNDARHVEHPGFKRVQSHIANQEDPRHPGHKIGEERAGAILAARSRNASAAAKRRNPDLRKVNT